VLPDLRNAIAIFSNKEAPDASEVDRQFKQCNFTAVNLGTLGTGVLVEWNPLKAPNAQLLNIYVYREGSFERLLSSVGTPPTFVPGIRSVPDIIFGWTEGVCQARYSRYRYEGGRYVVDACNQETAGKNDECAITECGSGLSTFPNPNR
jgi:hypothetical protein